jgi:uncharacterized protein DUF3592
MRKELRKNLTRLRTLEDDTLPHPLQRSPPREVALNSSGWVTASAAVTLLLAGIVGGPLLAQKLMEDSARATELQASRLSTEAVVTEVRRSRENKPRVTIRYRYSVEGQEFANRVQLRRDDPIGRTVKTGYRIRVLYLPSEPGRSWAEGYGPREKLVWAAAILPVVGIPGAMLIFRLLRRQKRLLEEGRAVMARVISTEKSKHHDSWSVTYSWSLLSGAVRKAHMSRTTEPAGPGSFVPVVYDPDQPERHSVYPLSLVRLR